MDQGRVLSSAIAILVASASLFLASSPAQAETQCHADQIPVERGIIHKTIECLDPNTTHSYSPVGNACFQGFIRAKNFRDSLLCQKRDKAPYYLPYQNEPCADGFNETLTVQGRGCITPEQARRNENPCMITSIKSNDNPNVSYPIYIEYDPNGDGLTGCLVSAREKIMDAKLNGGIQKGALDFSVTYQGDNATYTLDSKSAHSAQ